MSVDTRKLNQNRQTLSDYDEIWLFGYGSLIYKVDFDFLASQTACIYGYARRFWQGSHDHRGTPALPGRVLTLVAQPNARCFGKAYRVSQDVFVHLDHREKNGYLRHQVALELADGRCIQGLVYIAEPDNEAWLGEASIAEIARHIDQSQGPSGHNRDYVLDLARALREYGEIDEHVFDVAAHLLSLSSG